ncbi:hypothetical protein MPER_16221 [Moniliophthora perniciosa FA553]|nr:hypothetical protein MPER_16221 [Moniliophthora perniciosa FA553]
MDTRFVSPLDESALLLDGTTFPGIDDAPTPAAQATPQQQEQKVSGAWGSKSFASALHSTAPTQSRNGGASRPQQREEDEWEMDIAWHELEQRSNGGNGGRKKRSNKLVVLGGGGGRKR